MVELYTYSEDCPRFPRQHIGLAAQLCRLDSDLIFRLASQIVNDPKEEFFCYRVDSAEGLLYCRWDNYVRTSRLAILLFLQIGHVRRFILHCCHVGKTWEKFQVHVYNPNRRAAFDEIQDVIDNLENPENTEFFVDTPRGLHSYRTRQFPPRVLCTFKRDSRTFCGLWTSYLASPHRTGSGGCMCCCNACFSLPSRRKSVVVINPTTGRAKFHWLYHCRTEVT